MLDLDEVAAAANRLEPLPAHAARIAQLVASERATVQDMEEVIAFDPALTGQLLRAANSAAAAAGSRIQATTARDAVNRLGTGTVLSLVIGSAVKSRLQRGLPELGIAEGELWRHAILSALAAQAVREQSRREVPAESFTAALLHDVGKLVMGRFLDEERLDFLRRAEAECAASGLVAERDVLGVHHGELGALIAQHWGLPTSIVRGVQYHHTPEEIDDPIAYVAHLATLVADQVAAGADAALPDPDDYARTRAELGIEVEQVERMVAVVSERGREMSDRGY